MARGEGQAGDIERLEELQRMIENYLREEAERQGIDRQGGVFQITPKAYRLFQGKLLERIFSQLEAARSGRHQGPIVGEGAVEMQATKPYEFGDSITHMDMSQTFVTIEVAPRFSQENEYSIAEPAGAPVASA